MTKSELVNHVAETAGITRSQAADAVDAIFDNQKGAIVRTLNESGKFTMTGFGTFMARERPARKGRNPQTGKEIDIAASRSAGFSASKSLKDALQG